MIISSIVPFVDGCPITFVALTSSSTMSGTDNFAMSRFAIPFRARIPTLSSLARVVSVRPSNTTSPFPYSGCNGICLGSGMLVLDRASIVKTGFSLSGSVAVPAFVAALLCCAIAAESALAQYLSQFSVSAWRDRRSFLALFLSDPPIETCLFSPFSATSSATSADICDPPIAPYSFSSCSAASSAAAADIT